MFCKRVKLSFCGKNLATREANQSCSSGSSLWLRPLAALWSFAFSPASCSDSPRPSFVDIHCSVFFGSRDVWPLCGFCDVAFPEVPLSNSHGLTHNRLREFLSEDLTSADTRHDLGWSNLQSDSAYTGRHERVSGRLAVLRWWLCRQFPERRGTSHAVGNQHL